MSRSHAKENRFTKITKRAQSYIPTKRAKFAILGVLAALIVLVYFAFSLQFVRAELISDEIGYLTKAAALAGYNIDNASSWHAGYSLFLAPTFRIFSDPILIRIGVFFINALLFGGSLIILFFSLKRFFPKKSFLTIFAVVIVSCLYPAWIVMTGYAFATPAFLFLFMLSVWILLSQKRRYWGAYFGIITGFLFWVHPLGLTVILSAILVMLYRTLRTKEFRVLMSFTLVVFVMVLVYYKVLHPWLNDIMNMGIVNDHYAENIDRLSALINPNSWLNAITIALGRISYVLIGSFGITVFAIGYLVELFKQKGNKGNRVDSNYDAVSYVLIAIVILIIFTSLSLGANMHLQGLNDVSTRILYRVDHWIYGRYTDMLLLPLIGIGLLTKWRFKYVLIAVMMVVFAGASLELVVNQTNTNLASGLIAVNIPSYWPLAIKGTGNYLIWSLLGALAMLGVFFLRAKALFAVIPLIVITVSMQFGWHKELVFDHGDIYAATQAIRNVQSSGCIGFDAALAPDSHPRNRLRSYSFYLYDRNLHTQTYQEWLSGNCNFFFTDNPEIVKEEGVRSVFRSDYVQLFLFAKTYNIAEFENEKDFGTIFVNKNYPNEDSCVIKGCFSREADQFKDSRSNFVLAGELKGNYISTNGSEGYLFYGPYLPLRVGNYKLTIKGQFMNPKGAILEVVSTEPAKLIYESEIHPFISNNVLEIPFIVREDSLGVEVRLKVSSETEVMISGYEINLN